MNKNTFAVKIKEYLHFHVAAYGTATKLKQLLDNCGSVDVINKENQTLLHVAVNRGNFEIIRMLIDHSINVDSADKDGQTALHIAAEKGYEEITQILINAGSSLCIKNKNGKNPLDLAQQQKNSTALVISNSIRHKFLHAIHCGDRQHVIQWLSEDVHTSLDAALHLATVNNDSSMVSLLLSQNVSVSCIGQEGKIPLHIAAANGNLNILQLLLSKFPDLDVQDYVQYNTLKQLKD
ncbi:ankyrin-2 isoform X1, partial [Thraustotheca clavata]